MAPPGGQEVHLLGPTPTVPYRVVAAGRNASVQARRHDRPTTYPLAPRPNLIPASRTHTARDPPASRHGTPHGEVRTLDDLLAARLQMALSLGFHMIFAALGLGMPLLMLIAEGLWLRTRRPHYLALARTWGKATGVLFAIGAISGTALSFELGLLWPAFMELAGPAIGPGFAAEAFAFFTEAIFLGLYLYGWDRLPPLAHWLTGIPVALSAAASSVLVVATNAWMQHPVGIDVLRTNPDALDPLRILFGNPAWPLMAIHSTVACYAATGYAVMAVYAWQALRGRRDALRRSALEIAFAVGTLAAISLPLTGHASAVDVARRQPAKLAAMEAQFRTEARAPLRVGGIPDPEGREVRYALEIPGGLSWLAFGDSGATVTGLDRFPRDRWPNVVVTHVAFQVMVLSAFAMLGASAAFAWHRWRRRAPPLDEPGVLRLLVAAGPLGFLALEAGWVVTEVGRQPWIVYGVMRTAEALTPAPGVVAALIGFTALYLVLTATLVYLLRRLRHEEAGEVAPRAAD